MDSGTTANFRVRPCPSGNSSCGERSRPRMHTEIRSALGPVHRGRSRVWASMVLRARPWWLQTLGRDSSEADGSDQVETSFEEVDSWCCLDYVVRLSSVNSEAERTRCLFLWEADEISDEDIPYTAKADQSLGLLGQQPAANFTLCCWC